ncbi:MAG: AzlD domain-containing protein [Clostridia bacterium]|nr:AzlD domain-containing protein [Clostridia bacterium]MBQ7091872.1 AzlD domain-containing protein [Clostridia bacterium]
MSKANIFLLILGMTAVTYIPRAIPAVLVGRMKFGPKVKKFLRLIPYTALAVLIFPGILSVDAAKPIIGLVGGAVAAFLAWKKCPLILCVLAAIGTTFMMYMAV